MPGQKNVPLQFNEPYAEPTMDEARFTEDYVMLSDMNFKFLFDFDFD